MDARRRWPAGLRQRAIGAVLGACGWIACSRQPSTLPPPQPSQVSGTISIVGLAAPVRVVRDRWGVPHIYAKNQDDLFLAQGFVQAQDRLFQMDLWRRSVQGRFAEVLGSNFIERDAMTRRMEYRGDLAAEWASYGPDTQAIATAFVRGINAWVDIALAHLPEEFLLAGWRPDHWRPADLLNRTDAFLMSAGGRDEVLRARLVTALGVKQADALAPLVPASRTDVPRGIEPATISYVLADALRRVGTAPFFSGLAAAVTEERPKAFTTASASTADATNASAHSTASGWNPRSGIGNYEDVLIRGIQQTGDLAIASHAWAIGAVRSATGSPLLAVDPHTALSHPSWRYLVHLNAPEWNVIGATTPWLPGVVMGHNDRMAWGMSGLDTDVQDLYEEKVNPTNPHQVEASGRWVDTEIVADSVLVRGRDKPFAFEREYTKHGVVLAVDRERHRVFTVQWTGFEPGAAAELGSLALDRAQTVTEMRAALDRWKLPAVVAVYATADGFVGAEPAAWRPARSEWNGALPVPGWSGNYEWRGSHPVPRPPITESSNRVSNGRTPAQTRTLNQTPAPLTVDDLARLQNEPLAVNAFRLVPLLQRVHFNRPDLVAARDQLLNWDRRLSIVSDAVALYLAWEHVLIRSVAQSRIPPDLVDEFVVRFSTALVAALSTASPAWFGAHPIMARDAMVAAAFETAMDRRLQPPGAARDGGIFIASFKHSLGITDAARRRFNIGPFSRPGDSETAAPAARFDLEQTAGSPFRAIFDVADWDRSVAMNAPGQSGSPTSPHFADLAALWVKGEYFPLVFSEEAVQAHAETTLTLVPPR
jgi:penicillin G amidase